MLGRATLWLHCLHGLGVLCPSKHLGCSALDHPPVLTPFAAPLQGDGTG